MAQPNDDGLNALHHLCRKAMSATTIAETASLALDEAITAIAPDLAFLYGAGDSNLVLQGVRPAGHIELPANKSIGECLCGLAAREMKPIFSLDIHTDSRCTLPECKAAKVRSFVALPLRGDNELIGVLCLASMTERDFAIEGNFLETMAATVALTIKKAMVLHELGQQALDLQGRLADCTAELSIRNAELERLKKIFVDREFRIKELKDKLQSVKKTA
jgi:GAF domain-containing protein